MATYITSIFKRYNPNIVYLCVKEKEKEKEKMKHYYYSLNFKCIKFDTYEEADSYYKKKYNRRQEEYSTFMPLCRFIPSYFHEPVLNYKLSKLFINAEICEKNE